MNPFKIFNKHELKKIERIEILEDREYTYEEFVMLENKILTDIMSNSSKNGDIDKAREEYISIIDKFEKCRKKLL